MGIDKILGKLGGGRKMQEPDVHEEIARLETAQAEIRRHVEAGNGVREDHAQIEQLEQVLAGLREKAGIPIADRADDRDAA